jgi:hypothetical protein
MDEKGLGQSVASPAALFDLLVLCLTPSSILVLDGVDECVNHSDFVRSLLKLYSASKPAMLVLSRITVHRLKVTVPAASQIKLPKDDVSRDIRIFVSEAMDELVADSLLRELAPERKQELIDRIQRGADGMFLWARLMVQFLRSPVLTPEQRLRTITEINFPEGLETMYERILSGISKSGSVSAALAARTLTWLAHAILPLSSQQIIQALKIEGILDSDAATSTDEFEESIIMASAGLVELSRGASTSILPKGSTTLRFIHLSVKDMLRQHFTTLSTSLRDAPNYATALRLPDTVTANLCISRCCLQQLLYHTPAGPLSGKMGERISSEDLHSRFNLTEYAAVAWTAHMTNIFKTDLPLPIASSCTPGLMSAIANLSSTLQTFLGNPRVVSAWLEGFYTARQHRETCMITHPPAEPLRKWAAWLEGWATGSHDNLQVDSRLLRDICSFSDELDEITHNWGFRLLRNPEIIWDEMTSLTESRFFFSPGTTKVSLQTIEKPTVLGIGQNYVAMVSQTSAAGEMKGVLSIWPPRYVAVIQLTLGAMQPRLNALQLPSY